MYSVRVGTASVSRAGPGLYPRLPVGVLLCALVLLVPDGLDAQQRREQHSRLFPPEDFGLLEMPDRDQWQRPDQIMDALGIAEAAVVADVGAGSGWFTVRLARRVGPNGQVYAQDVQLEGLRSTRRRVRREGLTNVTPVLGLGSDPRLPVNTFDAVLIVDAYHEIEDRVTLLSNVARALKPHGRIGVVAFKVGGGGPGPPVNERVSPEVVREDAKRAGLRVLKEETFLLFQYFLVLVRSDYRAPGLTR